MLRLCMKVFHPLTHPYNTTNHVIRNCIHKIFVLPLSNHENDTTCSNKEWWRCHECDPCLNFFNYSTDYFYLAVAPATTAGPSSQPMTNAPSTPQSPNTGNIIVYCLAEMLYLYTILYRVDCMLAELTMNWLVHTQKGMTKRDCDWNLSCINGMLLPK